MKKIILHIGFQKTGTSAIQSAILKNENILNEYGIGVIDRERDAFEIKKWLFPGWYGITDLDKQESLAIEQLQQLKSDLFDTYVWSEENFSNMVSFTMQESLIEKLDRVIKILNFAAVDLILYYRKPVDAIESLYKQNIRNKNFNYCRSSDFLSFDNDFKSGLNWHFYIKQLNQLANLNTVNYDTVSKNLVADFFLRFLSINLFKNHDQKVNESLSFEKIKLLESVGKLSRKQPGLPIGWIKETIINADFPNIYNKSIFSVEEKKMIKKHTKYKDLSNYEE